MQEIMSSPKQSEPAEPGFTDKPLRVLIVDDSENDALILLHTLRKAGYQPAYERVCTVPAMKAALQKQVWDIVISDYEMPGFGGFEALQLLQESNCGLLNLTEFLLGAGAGVQHQDYVKWRTNGSKEGDVLLDPTLVKSELVRPQIRDVQPVAVSSDHRNSHQTGINLNGFRLLLRLSWSRFGLRSCLLAKSPLSHLACRLSANGD